MARTAPETAKAPRRAGGEKRRPQILRAAARLFQRGGFHATTMDDVADAVKLNKATLYYHFPGGKTDLLYAINTTALEELQRRLKQDAVDGDPLQRLRGAIEVMLGMQVDFPDETVVLHEETRWLKNVLSKSQHRTIVRLGTAVRGFVQEILDDGISDRTFADCDAPFVAAWIVSVTGSAFSLPRRPGDAQLPEVYAELILGGLLRRSGRRGSR